MNIKQVVTAAALTSIAIATPAWAADQPKQLQRDADALKATGATGVLAAVTTPRGTSAARSGVADLKTGEPVPWNAYYRIGSTTKTFVAAIALQLVGEGKLRLDDTVERWLPGLVEGNGNDGAKITLRQLLGQTSGLPEYADDVPLERVTSEAGFRRERFRVYRPEEFVAMAMRHKPAFEPGKGWAYSNTNYVLVGMIIEKVTGTPWQQQLLERVIEPLGLRHTYAPGTSPFLPQPRMTTYKRFTADGPMADVTTFFPGGTDHSLVSTPDDVNRFFSALLGGRLLRPAELAEMTKTVPATPFRAFWRDAGYGLGIMKRRLPCGGWVWFHGGGGWNAISDNAVTADGRRVASVAYSSALRPDQDPLPQIKAAASLIDHALC